MTNDKREQIRLRLEAIENANAGRLTPDAVLADARDPESPLHDQFEWDKDKASQAYWIEQARELITSVRVIVKTETTTVRSVYYVRDPSAEHDEQGYVSVKRLRTDADMAREALVAEFSRVADMLRRAREMAVVLEMQGEVDELVTGIVGIRQRIEAMPAQTM